jgi:ABC-type nitrate/sulfonate/bicarbonate transport system ATPase subunit/ABC-type nitrate/sulfonate/bicarbonate transport system permease component
MSGKPRAVREKRAGLRLYAAAGTAILLALWTGASMGAGRFFVPPPWTTIADSAFMLADGFTWRQIGITVMRVFAGFTAGFLAGLAAGIAAGSRRELDALIKPLLLFFQGMPPLLWVIPIIVVMGIGHLPTILVIGLITMPVVAVTIAEGMGSLPREYGEMLSVFAPGWLPRIRELVFPHLKPFLAASLKVGLVLAAKASVTAEYFGANNGIGFQIQAAYQSMQIRRLFAWALLLILLILFFNHAAPRVRLLAPLARGVLRRKAPVVCRIEDIRELKRIFVSKKSAPRITLEGVGFSYKHSEPILAGVTLSVSSRDIAVISGESGVGKTTLLKIASSLLRPTAGRVSCPASVGFVFQDDRLLPWKSVAENTALPLVYQGYPRKSALCFAQYLLAEAGLEGEEGKKPAELSGGMKKRAALARCFARLPEAIILDEPFTGLHKEARVRLWEMFLRLLALHPVPALIVTHAPEEVAGLASCRLYALKGRPATLLAGAPHERG